ncbi:hypothetical protein BDR07DRAFT_1441767 [Suillus spraguei]|nr:hypothetical protein BDR07DRAFT_1441767 [Suillus spraguei]
MSHLPEPRLLTEKLTVKKVLRAVGAGTFVLSNIINSICIAIIFVHLGSTIPVLKPYATYVAGYTFGARTMFLTTCFCWMFWCCLRLVAPKQAGNSISEWGSKLKAQSSKPCRAWRITAMGILNIINGLLYGFPLMERTRLRDQLVMAVIFFMLAPRRALIKKGVRGENMTVGNTNSQPELNEVTPACGHKDDDTTTQ